MLGRHERAAEWLQVWTDLGRAPRTIDAYARGLAEYLQVCERDGVDPLAAGRAQVAAFVRELASRPSLRGANVVSIDSGVGLANATLQQRLVAVRLFYEFLVEEGVRELVRSRSKQWGEWGGRVFRELRDLGVGDSRGVGGSGGCVSDRGMRAPEGIVVG